MAPIGRWWRLPTWALACLAAGLVGCGSAPTPATEEITSALIAGARSANVGGGDQGGDNRLYVDAWHAGSLPSVTSMLRTRLEREGYQLRCPASDIGDPPTAQRDGEQPQTTCRVDRDGSALAFVWLSTTTNGREVVVSAVVG